MAAEHRFDNAWIIAGGLKSFRSCPEWEMICPNGLLLDFERQPKFRLVQNLDIVGKTRWAFYTAISTCPIDITADRDQRMKCPVSLHPGAERIDAVARNKAGWPISIKFSRGDDIPCSDTSQFCYEFRGIAFCTIF